MSLIEDIPEELLSVWKKKEFIIWLRTNIEPPHTRKYMLIDWCNFVGVPISKELVEEANIPKQV